MPDDNIDTRNGAYDAVSPAGKEPYTRTDAEGQPQQVWKNPIPLRLERDAAPPLNRRTGRHPTS